jgi:hypothetical protein
MKRRRLRIGTALSALLTLLALQSEAVWASRCAPPAPASETKTEMADCDQAAASHSPAPEPAHQQHRKAPLDCPLLAIAGGSCVPASLPAEPSAGLIAGASGRVLWAHRASPGLILASGPFHPPRL